MTTIEEQIWDYIDGNGDSAYRTEIGAKIATDPLYSETFESCMAIHLEMNEISLDEPSMGFTNRVMDAIEKEPAPVALKTRLDRRIVFSIAGFFIIALLAIVATAISESSLSIGKVSLNIDFERYISPSFIKLFLFIDSCIALLYFDGLLRKKRV